MKRGVGKRIKGSFRLINEDLQELQRHMRHKSVYAKKIMQDYNRRPKHAHRVDDFYGSYS